MGVEYGARGLFVVSPEVVVDQGRREALERLLASRTLESRPRLREFLRYVGEAALEGRAAGIREQAIGTAVFGRPRDYSVNEDTIVRVTARQLRQKIDEYYAGEGRDDRWQIVIPRGTYIPVFQEPVASAAVAEPAPAPAPRRRVEWGWLAAGFLAIVCAALWWRANARPEVTLLGLMQEPAGQRVSIVYGDAVVQLYKQLTGWAPKLAEYQNGSYRDSAALRHAIGAQNKVWDAMKDQRLVATGSLQLPAQLARSMPTANVVVRHPRDVNVREFSDDNVILLSGPFSNPWVQLFESRLNFRIEQDAPGNVFIRNVKPQSGEQGEYRLQEGRWERTTYARLAYLPNLSGKGKVLLIGGPSAPLMEIMGTAASDPEFLRGLAHRFATRAAGLPWCEILMEVKEMATAPMQARIVAVRRVE
jgi:hypothetical protein